MADPKDYRVYANTCRRIAGDLSSVWDQQALTHIADRWEQLPRELATAPGALLERLRPHEKGKAR